MRFALETASAPDGSRDASDKAYETAVAAFQKAHGGPEVKVAILRESALGVYLTATDLQWCVLSREVRFDWSDGLRLLWRIDAVAEQARYWWDNDDPDRRAILERSYGIMTGILAAAHHEHMHRRARGIGEEEPVTQRYVNSLDSLVPEVERAEAFLETAAQRKARSLYALGMLLGASALAVVCALLGVAFSKFDTPAWYGVALPAGAVGALVSVLQRMTSGKLRLDVHAGSRMTLAYGALRPVIGGILAMAIFALLEGELLPSIEVAEGSELPFYAGLGFLAGFNERFAQDMLTRSAGPLNASQA